MSLDFLSAVLPTQGKYCVFTLRNNRPFKQIFVETLDNVSATAHSMSGQQLNVFHALASFDEEGYRRVPNALFLRSFFLDLDCGAGKAFASKRVAVEALYNFLQQTGLDKLGTVWLIDSGGGVHAYFALTQDVNVAEWFPVAESLKRAAKALTFPIDETVTSDAARVLRTPGTQNWKYETPKDVVIRQRGTEFVLADIAAALVQYSAPVRPVSTALTIPGNRPNAVMSPIAKAMAGNNSTFFRTILDKTMAGTGCKQVQQFIERAGEDGMEPMWRAMLSITKHCDDGEKASLKISRLHPYDEDRMHQKLQAIVGPYSCLKIESTNTGGCEGCPHKGRITNPLALGRVVQVVEEESTVEYAPEVDTDEAEPIPTVTYIRPQPPRSFAFGQNGGLYYRKPPEKPTDEVQEIMLTNYDFFMTRMFNDGTEYMAEFVAVKNGVFYSFGVPTDTMGAAKEIVKVLARNNVVAVGGAGCDNYLASYVRACVSEASSSGKHVNVPPHMGWQFDDSFAVGDTVYSPKARTYDYTFKSTRLHNVIESLTAKGSLEGWQGVANMMISKARREPIVWGHVATMLIGFASPLMRFAPAGARAVTFHLAGKASGAGKTLASNLANSVWGDPTGGQMVSNKTSETTLMQRAGMLHSLHLNVDEVTDRNRKSKGEWLPNYLYDYAHGAHKVKGSNIGNAEIVQDCTWAAISIVSSNDPQMEAMMGAREHTSMGESRRVIEWKFPRNWEIQFTSDERKILEALNTNYGVAGRKFIMWVQQNMDTAREVYAMVEQNWRKDTRAHDNERFWTSGSVGMLAAAILLGPEYSNLLTVPVKEVFRFMSGLVRDMRFIINENATSALDILNAYTREYTGSFVLIDCSASQKLQLAHLVPNVTRSKAAVRGRIEYEIAPGYTDYYIEIKLLKLHCASIGHSYLDFERELKLTPGITIETGKRKDLLAHTQGPSLRVLCMKITMETKDVDPEASVASL